MKSFALSNIICFLFSFILSNDLTNIASLGFLLKKATLSGISGVNTSTATLKEQEC